MSLLDSMEYGRRNMYCDHIGADENDQRDILSFSVMCREILI